MGFDAGFTDDEADAGGLWVGSNLARAAVFCSSSIERGRTAFGVGVTRPVDNAEEEDSALAATSGRTPLAIFWAAERVEEEDLEDECTSAYTSSHPPDDHADDDGTVVIGGAVADPRF